METKHFREVIDKIRFNKGNEIPELIEDSFGKVGKSMGMMYFLELKAWSEVFMGKNSSMPESGMLQIIDGYCELRYREELENAYKKLKEDEFLHLSIKSLKNVVDNFGSTQDNAKWALRWSGFAAMAALVAIFIGPCKSESTSKEIQVMIDTSSYKSVLEYRRIDRLKDSLSFYRIESDIDSLQRRIDSLEVRGKMK